MRWFDRSFTFDVPVWLFPNLVERLRGTPARVEEMVRLLPASYLTQRYGAHWSIQENLGHLLDLEPLWLGRVEDILNGEDRLREADLTNSRTDAAQYNDRAVEEIQLRFREARQSFVASVDGINEEAIERTALHPRLLQPLRLIDLVYFVVEHDDHHLAQIRRLWKSYDGM